MAPSGLGTKPFHKLVSDLPDIVMIFFFGLSVLLALKESVIAEFLSKELSLWFVYELIGAFFLLFWVAINEEPFSHELDLLRFESACAVYIGFAVFMYLVFRASLSCVILSAVGGIWALLNPLLRHDRPSVFQIGREAALALAALVASFFIVASFASIAEKTIPRPFHPATFEAVMLMSLGAVYYLLRWRLARRLAAIAE
jgi:hypothetical protein